MRSFDDTSGAVRQPLPRRFGNHTLLRALGRGGTGEVFLARKVGDKSLCVVRTVRVQLAGQELGLAQTRARFMAEVGRAMQLAHPGICRLLDVGIVDEVPFTAMEFVAGVTLRDILEMPQLAVPMPIKLWIVHELLVGLDAAHTAGVVHGDVSPDNVMIGFEGEVKLMDFGLAGWKPLALRSPAYLAPGQMHGISLDGRADQYALAVIACELFTGERFYGNAQGAMLAQLVAAGGHRPLALAFLPPPLVSILDRALQPSREARFPRCSDMAKALRHELAKLDPLMSQSTLRAFVHDKLGHELASHKQLLRVLPGAPKEDTRPQPVRPSPPVTVVVPPPPPEEPTDVNDRTHADASDSPSTDQHDRRLSSSELAFASTELSSELPVLEPMQRRAPVQQRDPITAALPTPPRGVRPHPPPQQWWRAPLVAAASFVVVFVLSMLAWFMFAG